MRTDTELLEELVPAHLLTYLGSCVRKDGFDFRQDWIDGLNSACAKPLQNVDALTLHRVAKRTDEIVSGMVRGLNANHSREALLSAAFFMFKLLDEGLWRDVQHVAATTAALLVADFEADPEFWGTTQRQAGRHGNKLVDHARWSGLYLGTQKHLPHDVNQLQ